MGWLSVILSVAAAYIFYEIGSTILMIAAIMTAIGSFWSLGVMHNYATELAKNRSSYKGGFYDFTKQEAMAVPDWISFINLSFSIAGLILFIIGIFMLIKG